MRNSWLNAATWTGLSHLVPNSTFTFDLKHVLIRSRASPESKSLFLQIYIFCSRKHPSMLLPVSISLDFVLWHASNSFRNRIRAVIGKKICLPVSEEKKYNSVQIDLREACLFRFSLEEMRGHIERDKVPMYALILCSGKQESKCSTGIMSALIPYRRPHVLSTKRAFSVGVCG